MAKRSRKKKYCECKGGKGGVYQNPKDWRNNNVLRRNYNISYDELLNRLSKGEFSNDTVYVYVIITTRVVGECPSFMIRQEGCGPNFEGGIITLTTCKHNVRCWNTLMELLNRDKPDRDRLWIAGVTTREKDKNVLRKNFLFYLMKVDSSISAESFYDLWNIFGQVPNVRNAKNASHNPVGDLYEPINCNFNVSSNKWNVMCYKRPNVNHVHNPNCNRYQQDPNCWRNCDCGCWVNDISYYQNNRTGNRPLLLVGENPFIGRKKGASDFNSYLWTEPKIKFTRNIGQGTLKMSLREFLNSLKPYKNCSSSKD